MRNVYAVRKADGFLFLTGDGLNGVARAGTQNVRLGVLKMGAEGVVTQKTVLSCSVQPGSELVK